MKKFLFFLASIASMSAVNAQVIWSDNFNDQDISDWTRHDVDGDGLQWGDIFQVTDMFGTPVSPVSLISRSWQVTPLTPDNWVISPAINLSGVTGTITLKWKVQAAAFEWDNEHYSVYVATANDMASLGASAVNFSETYDDPADAGSQYSRSLDISSFAGQTVYVAFRHHDVTDMDWLSIDDVSVEGGEGGGPVEYCEVTYTSNVEPITHVMFAGIDNTTSAALNGTPAMEDFTSMSATVDPDSSYDITLEGNTDGSFTDTFTVFIDWNQNGDFSDAGEKYEAGSIFNSTGTDGQQAVTSIAVPADAMAGDTRMRIIKDWTLTATPVWPANPCGTYDFGQTEDYTVHVTGGTEPPVDGCFVTGLFDQWPSTTYTPGCVGAIENITTAGWAGEFSKVQVSAGVEYIFSSSVATDFITIAAENEETAFATGTGSVTWTSPTNQVIRFYTHMDEDCTIEEVSRSRTVQCGDIPPPPEACEDYVVLSNNLENGLFFGGDTSQHLATDIQVADQPLTIYGMEPTVIDHATSFEFIIYSDNAGVPGTQIDTRSGIIAGEEITGNNFGFDFVKYTVGFDSALVLDANTTYWIEIISDAGGWESTSAMGALLGYGDVFYNVNVGEGVWTSTGGDEFVFNLICEELGANDMSSAFDFSYYPNPVKDVLNISAKKNVENVSVFNLAGQKVLSNAKVTNGQIDVHSLTPGTYVFRVTLEGGQVETFKIVKK